MDKDKRRIVTVGTFDGLHRGHEVVLGVLLEESVRLGLEPLAVTFDRHPLETIAPARAPRLLMDPEVRDEMIRARGIVVEQINFTEDVRSLTAEEWMIRLRDDYGASVIVLGYDNTFGSDGLNMSIEDFRAIGRRLGLEVESAPVVAGCSSSAIRKALAAGEVEKANEMLGRPYCITGTVIHGRELGRTIGIPTANVSCGPGRAVPENGVYSATVTAGGNTHRSVVNIGSRPTVTDSGQTGIEAHLLDFKGDLYGKTIEIKFIGRLRDEKKFSDVDALRKAIEADIRRVRGQ